MLKGIPEVLNLRFLDANQKPRANVSYIITIEGDTRRGKLDGDGRLREKIPPGAMQGKLVLMGKPDATGRIVTQTMNLDLGGLNPVTEVSGVKARLANLGFYQGPVDENMDDATQQALRAFQQKQGLPVTGQADDATQQALKPGGARLILWACFQILLRRVRSARPSKRSSVARAAASEGTPAAAARRQQFRRWLRRRERLGQRERFRQWERLGQWRRIPGGIRRSWFSRRR